VLPGLGLFLPRHSYAARRSCLPPATFGRDSTESLGRDVLNGRYLVDLVAGGRHRDPGARQG